MVKDSRGLSYTLEALIAASIVIIGVITLFSGFGEGQAPTPQAAERTAFSCVESVDIQGNLRSSVAADDAASINDELDGCLRGPFNHTTQICGDSCTSISLPEDEDISSVLYHVAGHDSTEPKTVIVYLWSVL